MRNDRHQRTIERLADLSSREVTGLGATENSFANRVWNHEHCGLYVELVSAEPLFAPIECGSGSRWPSLTDPAALAIAVERTDNDIFGNAVRLAQADSHVEQPFACGGVDGGGLPYCVDSAALPFVPMNGLEEEEYGDDRPLSKAPAENGKVTR